MCLGIPGEVVELLADRPDVPADAALRIQKIGGQADRASGVIRQVLTFVRDTGWNSGAVDLGAVVDRALALRRYQLGRAGIAVTWDRQPQEYYRVAGEERALEQLILNLLVNAEEALEGQPERRVSLTIARADGRVQLAVADSGPGVPPELRDTIFDPFFTTRSSSSRAVGLGLTVGAAIAAAHGGHLALERPGSGATFVLELPETPDAHPETDPGPKL
jgi:two-component system C4-dicarboxylate transport sensor histidine kinase DctB